MEGAGRAELAIRVLRAAFEGGDTSVIDDNVRPDYIQHNPLAADGPEAMKAFGAAWLQQFADAAYQERRVITDGDMVLLHSSGALVPGPPGLAVFDLFRFQDGKIAEHWDILQEVPAASANGNDMFATLSQPQAAAPDQRNFTARNRKLVTDFIDQVMVGKDLTAVDTYVDPGYREHDPDFPDGPGGLKTGLGAYLRQFPQVSLTPKRILAEGELVAVHSHLVPAPGERGYATISLYRVRDEKIIEHWGASQAIPETSANNNTMF